MNVGTPIAGNEGTAQVLISSMATEPRLSCNRLSVMSSTEYTCTQWFFLSSRMEAWAAPFIDMHTGDTSNCLIASCS